MNADSIKKLVVRTIDDLKATEISVIDVRKLTTITDYMIICTARSTRHAKAVAETVAQNAKDKQLTFVRVEGNKDSDWILVDLGDVVLHVMLANTRSFYSLEELWEPIKEMREQSG